MKLKAVRAEVVKDSRGEDTVSVIVKSHEGIFVAASPSGKSKGKYETPAFAESAEESVEKLNGVSEKIKDVEIREFSDLEKIEKIADKKFLGANSSFALQASILKALAASDGKELWEMLNPNAKRFPLPVGNVMGGGLHSPLISGKRADFQEFLVIPRMKNFSDRVRAMKKVHETLKELLKRRNLEIKLNDEGAWASELQNESCLSVLNEAIEQVKSGFDGDIKIGIDVASSSFYKSGKYSYKNPEKSMKTVQQIVHMAELVEKFQVFYLEDPLQEEAFDDFYILRDRMSKTKQCMIVGDDLTASNLERLITAIKKKSINGIIVKPNQNGSLIEIKKLIEIAKKYGVTTIMSHRSGETTDNTIADLAFAWQTEFIKTGVMGKERDSKLNRLIDIEIKQQV